MKKKTPPRSRGGPACLCHDAGPMLSELIRRLAPPAEARRHFEAARIEILKGIRAVIEDRINRRSRPKARGQAINVE